MNEVPNAVEAEHNKVRTSTFFIPGAGYKEPTLQYLRLELQNQSAEAQKLKSETDDEFILLNSTAFDPEQWAQAEVVTAERATELKNRLQRGDKVILIAHSYGAEEITKMLEYLAALPDEEVSLQNLDIVLISPIGFYEKKKWLGALVQLAQRFSLLVGESWTDKPFDVLNFLAPRFARGQHSFMFAPMLAEAAAHNGIDLQTAQQNFSEMFYELFFLESQRTEAKAPKKFGELGDEYWLPQFEVRETLPYQASIDWSHFFVGKEKVLERVREIDAEIFQELDIQSEQALLKTDIPSNKKMAAEMIKSKQQRVRALVIERGEVLSPFILRAMVGKVLEGENAVPAKPDKETEKKANTTLRNQVWEIVNSLPQKVLGELAQLGINFHLIVPEYDKFATAYEVISGLKQSAGTPNLKLDIQVLPLASHSSMYAQPKNLAEAIMKIIHPE